MNDELLALKAVLGVFILLGVVSSIAIGYLIGWYARNREEGRKNG